MLRPMPLSSDDIGDALDDLQHDLGKYLRLPLAFLPTDASDAEVRAAGKAALFETRRAGPQVEGAASIWARFRGEVGDALDAFPGFHTLNERVDGALRWAPRLREESGPIDRLTLEAEFSAVGLAIRALRDAFHDG